MSQMRKDVFTGRWVIMAETTTVQPTNFHFKRFVRQTTFCPFCETNEASTTAEVFAIRSPGSRPNGPGWSVRVVIPDVFGHNARPAVNRRPDNDAIVIFRKTLRFHEAVVATLRASDKIRAPGSAPIVALSECLSCLCGHVLGPIAKVNDAFWLTERPTDVVPACALVAAIGGYCGVPAHQRSH
jgi:hypothetical protein